MKKILLVFLLGLSLNIFAQNPPITTYEITSNVGYSNGLNFSNPFYIHVDRLAANVKDTTGLNLFSYTYSSIVLTDYTTKMVNDSLPALVLYPMAVVEVDTLTLDGMIEKYIKKNLETIFGAENVTKK